MQPESTPQTETINTEADDALDPVIAASRTAFLHDLPSLLDTHRAYWVAYRKDKRIGVDSSSKGRLHARLLREYPDNDFLICFVEPLDEAPVSTDSTLLI